MTAYQLERSLLFRRMIGRVRRSLKRDYGIDEMKLSTLRNAWKTADNCIAIRGTPRW